jgi:predicted nuclease of restriction endonuclease-like (RecB) superfamily
MNLIPESQSYQLLVDAIGSALNEARIKAVASVNTLLVQTNWEIGQYIVEFEQKGNDRAKYGDELMLRLSRDLTVKYGKGFSRSNLTYMRKFYISFPKSETLSHKLSWSHYFEILKAEDPMELHFYAKECEKENWSVRELKRQMNSMLFHRLALSKDKSSVLTLASEGADIQVAEDIIKDPYVLEFVGLPERPLYKEGDLEDALIKNLSDFLLELGKGFTFAGRQYKLNIGGRFFYVDLVFYHRILKCFVLIDLKRGEVSHEDIGQMNLYLNYFKAEENVEGDNEPIGIVLGAYKDKLLMEYATQNISNQLFVSKYQLYLPDRETLERELKDLLDGHDKKEGEEA